VWNGGVTYFVEDCVAEIDEVFFVADFDTTVCEMFESVKVFVRLVDGVEAGVILKLLVAVGARVAVSVRGLVCDIENDSEAEKERVAVGR